MDEGSILIQAAIGIATVVSTYIAWTQARKADKRSSDAENAKDAAEKARDEALELARRANSAFERQAVAQEEANRLRIEANTVPDWGPVEHVSGQVYQTRNQSGSDLILLSIKTLPENGMTRIRLRMDWGGEEGLVQRSDTLKWMLLNMNSVRPTVLLLTYRRVGMTAELEARVEL